MIRARVFLLFLMLASSLTIKAQDVVKRDTLGGTELSVTMPAEVGKLLDNAENYCTRAAAAPSHTTRSYSAAPGGDASYVASAPAKITVAPKALSNSDACRQNPRILGYKIQLTVVKSNEEAQKVKAYFRNRFPAIKAETDASLRPNYKILAGSYFSKASASSDLARIRQYFKSAIAIPYRVFCVEAK